MDFLHWLALLAVLSAWTVLFFTIRRWGPGRARRRVRCPVRKVEATVEVEQREGDFGSLCVTDVTACSLFQGSPLNCDKDCLPKL